MAAIRFRAASLHGPDGSGRLPELTPGFGLNLRLGAGQRSNVAGVDFGGTAVLAMHLSAGECRISGRQELEHSFSLVFTVDGTMALVDDAADGAIVAERGEVWAFSRSASFDLAVEADAQLVLVTMPVQVLQEFGIEEEPSLWVMDPDSTMVSPALGFLREIAVQEQEVPSVAAYFMEKLVHEMVGGMMLENRGARFAAPSRKGFFDQAMDYIAATAGDGSLTPATLAEELSLSLRQLQREFKRNNTSIATVILQHRIELAVRLLKDPKLDILPLEEIAQHSGFSSPVQLRRALRDAKAGSPSEIRSMPREKGQPKRVEAGSLVSQLTC